MVDQAGGELDDVAAALAEHLLDGELGDAEEAGQVDTGHRVVVGLGVVGERLGDENAGVVDQGVDAAEALNGGAATRSAVAGSAMSPWMVRMFGSWDGAMLREVATTA